MAWSASPDWQQNLSPPAPGAFPDPPPLKANYRFGWMKLRGGRAQAIFTKPEQDIIQLEVSGGSTGLVRQLWKLDATQFAQARASTLRPIRVKQIEDYGWKKIETDLAFTDERVTSQRLQILPDPVSLEKQKFQFPNLYDLLTALLYVRSQRLQPGDNFNLAVYPGNTAYLASVRVVCSEKIQVMAGKYNALKFEVRLQKITTTLGLEPHRKFKRAFIWISDDENRILLRVEAEIFVGSVWMELQSVKLTGN